MVPYASFLYFGILLYVAVPVVALRLAGRLPRWVVLVATAAMLGVQYSSGTSLPGGWREAWVVAAWAGYEWALVRGLLWTARPRPNRVAYRGALALALAPLACAKLGLPVGPLAFLGLSYVTFRALDALIAVGDGLVTAVPLTEYAAYVLFFPAISAGPIDRFGGSARTGGAWTRERSRSTTSTSPCTASSRGSSTSSSWRRS
jgi:membrane protein involved in D-alanine export